MDARELLTYIGRTGVYTAPVGLTFGVRVVNARISYGGLHLLITPEHGEGERWVSARSVDLN